MVKATRPPANGFVSAMRKVYNPAGFNRGYNFILFFIFAGALWGFCLARFQYLDFHGVFCGNLNNGNGAAPGECFWYLMGYYKVGIIMHLGCIIPAAFLACFQFVPAIRHKAITFHRINGYTILLLVILSDAGIFMFVRVSLSGLTRMFPCSGAHSTALVGIYPHRW